MAAPRSLGRGGAGWAIVVAALAVPGFLFYNWRSRLKSEHDRGGASKARGRVAGGVFQTPLPASERLTNPIASAPARAASSTHLPRAAPAPASAARADVVETEAAPTRDPMASPADLARRRESELGEAERRALENAAGRRSAPRRARKSPPIEKAIELQGIIAAAGGKNLAMINGVTIAPGQSFTVPHYSGKVKALAISSVAVTLEHEKRRFTLRVKTR